MFVQSERDTSRLVIARLWIILLWSLAFFTATIRADSVISNVTIVSPHLDDIQPRRHVFIHNGRIQQISSVPIANVGNSVQVIDGLGMYLVPGIFDGHVHVSAIPGMGYWGQGITTRYPKLADAYFRQQSRSLLYYGVTQVLDPNAGIAWQRFVDAPLHPDYFRCEQVATRDSYPLFDFDDEDVIRLYPYFIIDETKRQSIQTKVNPARHTPEAVVKRIAENGGICVKLFVEDGFGNASDWPLISSDIVERVLSAAKQEELMLLGHANALDMYKIAISYPVDVLVHGMWNWGALNTEQGVPPAIESILHEVERKNIGVMPTFRIIYGLRDMYTDNVFADENSNKVITPALREWYLRDEAQWFKREIAGNFASDGIDVEVIPFVYNNIINRNERIVRYLDKRGVPLLLGSDTPGSPSYINQPGLNTYLEMQAMAKAGISLDNILAAATINNARQFNMSDDYGSVEVGKVANLLLLHKNPLQTLDAWDSIHTVVLHGQAIERNALLPQ